MWAFFTIIWGPPFNNRCATNFWWTYIFAAATPLFVTIKIRDKYKFDTGVSIYTIFYLLVWPGAMEHFPSSSLKIFAICIYTHNIFCGSSQKLLFLDTFYISFILFRTIVQWTPKFAPHKWQFYIACKCECTTSESVLHCMCLHPACACTCVPVIQSVFPSVFKLVNVPVFQCTSVPASSVS